MLLLYLIAQSLSHLIVYATFSKSPTESVGAAFRAIFLVILPRAEALDCSVVALEAVETKFRD
jgi:hypothetical protein